YQLVLNKTPFYPEGGGQVGDTGLLIFDCEVIQVLDTIKENDLTIHIIDRLPENLNVPVFGEVDAEKRTLTENNHSATHLLHAALRQVLGNHVHQKGSLVKDEYLRFDISHYQKVSDQEIEQVENIVNEKIRENIHLEEARSIPVEEAKNAGAMMLFGEKYGDVVRMITFDPAYSRELCGGCHVKATGQIGFFKITSESGIAAGVRRIEAVTAKFADKYISKQLTELQAIKSFFKNNNNTPKNVSDLIESNKELIKDVEKLRVSQAVAMKDKFIANAYAHNEAKIIKQHIKDTDVKAAKTLSANIITEAGDAVVLLCLENGDKVTIMLSIADNLVKHKNWHAGKIVSELAKEVGGGGGGQPFYASAGGSDKQGIQKVINQLDNYLN
ncbi:MAG TPA: DHHA1 domain-containing protein, partial [Saprospiraceae bacterium]|nr:DHHA1 domain-containing protein [Saprospiraceae bacterium]